MVPDHDSESFRRIDITAELAGRPAPARDDAAILLALAQTTAGRPELALQALADCALHSTGAHSAGISITDVDAGEDVFRWVATAGRFASQVHGTMPRWFSPAATCCAPTGCCCCTARRCTIPTSASSTHRSSKDCCRRSAAMAGRWAPCGRCCTTSPAGSTPKTRACSRR